MNANLMQRLEALEAHTPKRGDSDPTRLYQVMVDLDLEAPEPQTGEDIPTWLTRVPLATLRALMEMRDAHAQP